MTGGRKRLHKAMGAILSGKQDKDILVPALLGAYRNGQPTIIVAGRPDFVYVRLRGSQSEVVQAFNEKVAFHFDLPILVLRDENFSDRWIIHGRDIGQYASWEGSAYGVAHASSHAFAGADRTGSDIVWVNKCQYMPLLPRPEASGTMSLWIESDFYYFDGRYHWWPGSGTADLSGFRPTGAMNARYVTVYIDADGNPAGLAGPEFDKVYPGDPADYISIPDPDDGVVVAAVLFMTGTQAVGWGEIFDLRNPNQPPAPTGSPIWIADEGAVLGKVWGLNIVGSCVEAIISGSYGHIVHACTSQGGMIFALDDGVPLCSGSWVNFREGLVASCSGTVIAVDVEPPVTGSVVIFDEGGILGSVLGLNIVGPNFQVVVSGSYAHVVHADSPGGGGGTIIGVMNWDDGTPLCTGSIIDWGDNLDVSCSGTVLRVDASGGGGVVSSTTGTFYVEEMFYDVVLASATGSVVVSPVPQDGDHLVIRIISRTSKVADVDFVYCFFNNDKVLTNYRAAENYGGTTEGGAAHDFPYIASVPAANSPAGYFGSHTIKMLDYMVTGSYATACSYGGHRRDVLKIYSAIHFVAWEKLDAVTRIDLVPGTGNFIAGTHVQVSRTKNQQFVTSVA